MKTRLGLSVLFLAGVSLIVGCGGDGKKLYPVEGTVTVDGNTVEGAMVLFVAGDGSTSSGLTSATGKFRLLTDGKEGAPAGTYKVSVTKTVTTALDTGESQPDPTKSYKAYMDKTGMKPGGPGGEMIQTEKPKSEIPDRYHKPGSLPDQVVPASGPIPLELKSK